MKKTIIILASSILIGLLFISCQKAKEHESKKEVQVHEVQKEEVRQKSKEAKPEVQPLQQQLSVTTETKEEKKEKPAEPTVLTEQEQKEFSKWRDEWDRNTLSEKDAVKYLNILIRGNTQVKWYSEHKRWGTGAFEDDVCALVSFLANSKSQDGYKLTIIILENPDSWLSELKLCILESVKFFQRKESIPLIRRFLNYRVPRSKVSGDEKTAMQFETGYKLDAAGSLLYLGDADTALPALEELAINDGVPGALYYLFSGPGKIIDKRGYKIVEKALNNPKAEVRIHAVKLLLDAKKIEKEKAEEIALGIVETLKDKTLKDYGLTLKSKGVYDIIPLPNSGIQDIKKAEAQAHSDGRACESTINMLGDLKSKRAVPLLKYIHENNTGLEYVCQENLFHAYGPPVERIMKKILENGGGK